MLAKNLYIQVPIGAVVCYLFMLFCFFNAPKTRIVQAFRLVLTACIVWTAGAVLMRLQVPPGIRFWYNVSLFGLFLIPVSIYNFMFCFLEIPGKLLIRVSLIATLLLSLANGIWDVILAAPSVVERPDGTLAYTYASGNGIYIIIVPEVVLFLYVFAKTWRSVRGDRNKIRKLCPLLVGILIVAVGNLLEILPGNLFPYDTLSGVFMAACLVYIMFRQYMFDISYRVTNGLIYSVSLAVILMPVWFFANVFARNAIAANDFDSQELLLFMIILCTWSSVVVLVARELAEFVMVRYRHQLEELSNRFQSETASLFNEEELFEKLRDTLKKIAPGTRICVYTKENQTGRYTPQTSEDVGILDEHEEVVLPKEIELPEEEIRQELRPLKYDNQIRGFVYLKANGRANLNYIEMGYFHRIMASVSVCLKNVNIYEQIYQVTIHDELTGLYNRNYWKQYIQKKIELDQAHGLISLDIDDFKLYNELYGEDFGDELLKWCAKLLRETVGEKGTVFRLGGNEFIIDVETGNLKSLTGLARIIQHNVSADNPDRPHVLQPVTFSIGIAANPGTLDDFTELQRQAERACFYAKRNGKNRIEVYEAGIEGADDGEKSKIGQVAPIIYSLMATIDAKDSVTFAHSNHVSEYAVLLGKRLGIRGDDLEVLKEAGLLHDIGKIGIPESILKKEGKLTDEEYAIMKGHVLNSVEMIQFLPNMSYVTPAVISHHERYDGKGYPRGVAGEDIPLFGRILAVCDSFDAMVSKRSYKDSLSVEYAVEEIRRNIGTQFDPKVAEAFIQLVEEGRIEV